jgi:branched-chain amino acid transport system permease protein
VLRAYALALPAGLLMVAGAVTLIEIAYRLSTQPEAGTRMRLFWIPMNAATPWPWLGAAAVMLAGYFLLRHALPRARAARDLVAHG